MTVTDEFVRFSQSYGLWIQTGAIFVSAAIALIAIVYSRRIASKRTSIDLLLHEETDGLYAKQVSEFNRIIRAGNIIQFLAADKLSGDEVTIIRNVLNRYELLAIGIFEKSINENIYKRWTRSRLVDDWIKCKPFIMEIRRQTERQTIYCEFEKLARKWADKRERDRV